MDMVAKQARRVAEIFKRDDSPEITKNMLKETPTEQKDVALSAYIGIADALEKGQNEVRDS